MNRTAVPAGLDNLSASNDVASLYVLGLFHSGGYSGVRVAVCSRAKLTARKYGFRASGVYAACDYGGYTNLNRRGVGVPMGPGAKFASSKYCFRATSKFADGGASSVGC